ncbi:MAG: ATP-dependent helicase [Candidatus Acetothermia bacterium]|jgi:ATP-dependent Lhr-like helicase|nr:ATP-dependent helicase [Candidatus Acetothermia bacterium]MDH7505347.1 ATP-dependent helicase [Candidatus Acetothermia bacterium]
MIAFRREPFTAEEVRRALHPLVWEWFSRQFPDFSPPQQFAIPLIHEGKNCLISAPTGSGKTLAAFLAIISELVALAEKGSLENRIYALYISPLKALGNDIERNLNEPLRELAALAGRDLGIRVEVRTGDTPPERRRRMVLKAPHILITTPESFAIALSAKEFSKAFRKIRWVIVDEVHSLAESKRGVHLSLSLERLSELVEPVRIGLSATIHPLEEVAKFLVGRRFGRELADVAGDGADPYRDCVIVDARFAKGLDLEVKCPVEDFIDCSAGELYNNLYELLAELVEEHQTTLIFTNTRSRTERVVYQLKERRPKLVELIGAHHGSLSRELRLGLEERLKRGGLKAVVSSTSLELGIDIGYIDLVILLGSPKSVTRALQRVGRSGHKLHDRVKGRAIVTDQDDLLECAVMLKGAVENRLDRLHIPKNCLDVLAQQIFGILLDGPTYVEDLWELVTRSYNFEDLERADFERVLEYLAGEYVSLEDRRVYAKIWFDKASRRLGKRGRLARVIYMTNVGTIPDESYVTVKHGERRIGQIEESFLEYLRKGDIFVLGGETYQFRYSRGMTAQVEPAAGKSPTVPSWFSEMLPLSFDLALEIQEFRYMMSRMFEDGRSPEELKEFIRSYLHLDRRGVESVYNYLAKQHRYAVIPHRYKILVERYREGEKSLAIFHALFGRRVNEALARAIAWVIARREDRDVEIMVTDHGFALGYEGEVKVIEAFALLLERDLRETLEDALYDTEILKRRFRHCATRALMILKNYMGDRKSVGRQQMKALILQNAVEELDDERDFPVLKEAYREVLEDAMDIAGAAQILQEIREGKIRLEGRLSPTPSPFALGIILHGRSDLIKAEDRQEFLQRFYQQLVNDQ